MVIIRKKDFKRPLARKGGGVTSRIAPVGSYPDEPVKINIYGRSATGKTTLACSFPKPLLLIGAEDGKRSVKRVKGVDFVRIASSGELAELTEHAEKGSYTTIVLDAASSLQDIILKEILGIDELPAQGSWGMATREQWGQCGLQTKERLRSLLNLSCHVVIIAQEREFNTDGEGELLMPYVASALTPSVVGWLNPACDFICQTFIREEMRESVAKIGKKTVKTRKATGNVQYCLRTAPDPVYTTKFRVDRGTPLPKVVVDPSFEKIQEIISQGG